MQATALVKPKKFGRPVGSKTKPRPFIPPVQNVLPECGFVTMKQIIGDKATGLVPMLPISRSVFLQAVDDGLIPKPIKLTGYRNYWRVEDVKSMLAKFAKGGPAE